MGLSFDVVSCAYIVGTEGEIVVDCRRYGLELWMVENGLYISRQDNTFFHSFFLHLSGAC